MERLKDILLSQKTVWVFGDGFPVALDLDLERISLEHQLAVPVANWHRVAVGFETHLAVPIWLDQMCRAGRVISKQQR